MSDQPRTWRIGPEHAGRRLDVLLSQRLSLSRGQVRRLLADGGVTVCGRAVGDADKGLILAQGDTVMVRGFTPPEAVLPIAQPESPLTILARGQGYIVVDKLPGVPVHPLRADERGTVLNAVIARFPELSGVGEGGLRSGVVHRLDVETSGVLLIATDSRKWGQLRRAFRAHATEKIYRAIVLGRLREAGELRLPLAVTRHRPAQVRVVSPDRRGARWCDLSWRPVEAFDAATLVEVRLGTGFLHQVRVMLAHLGHPVAGDELYRPANPRDPTGTIPGAGRVMLHASSLRVSDVSAHSPDPPDFERCLQALRTSAR